MRYEGEFGSIGFFLGYCYDQYHKILEKLLQTLEKAEEDGKENEF